MGSIGNNVRRSTVKMKKMLHSIVAALALTMAFALPATADTGDGLFGVTAAATVATQLSEAGGVLVASAVPVAGIFYLIASNEEQPCDHLPLKMVKHAGGNYYTSVSGCEPTYPGN